ncbi:MAG: Fur family transcriptional regulator [Vampirovibrionales bacterium]|nr:Fur family transcriptional regulator [Vampirovibrionales bacterium]
MASIQNSADSGRQTDSAYLKSAMDVLKRLGFRLTKPRLRVLTLLDTLAQPVSAYEIRDRLLAEQTPVDIVSVYRILECLEQNGLIHRLLSSGKVQKCQLEQETCCATPHQADHCHHLFICERCHTVNEVHCPLALGDLVRTMANTLGFRVSRHSVEVFGLCSACN